MDDMNNLLVISNNDPIQPVGATGVMGNSKDLEKVADPPPQMLDGLSRDNETEQRYHQRFELGEVAFAWIRPGGADPLEIGGKSMGEIACAVFNARPIGLGKIDNISMGGLSFHHVDGNIQPDQFLVLDILSAERGFYLPGIRFRIIADKSIPNDIPGDDIETRQVRLQFIKMEASQKRKLKGLMLDHGPATASVGCARLYYKQTGLLERLSIR